MSIQDGQVFAHLSVSTLKAPFLYSLHTVLHRFARNEAAKNAEVYTVDKAHHNKYPALRARALKGDIHIININSSLSHVKRQKPKCTTVSKYHY